MVGDIVGGIGRRWFRATVAGLRADGGLHAVIANAENAAGGNGLTPALARELLDAGADVLTLGDHTWDQKEIAGWIGSEARVIRPANFAPACPGSGLVTIQTPVGPLTVINLVGRVFMPPADCPFRTADALLARAAPGGTPVIVDMHAEATSEKIALGWHLDGRVSAVIGSHTHVQTADERILPRGTAYCTDMGMTGPAVSVLGRAVPPVLKRFTTGMFARFEVADGPAVLEGVVIEINRKSCRAESIQRLRKLENAVPDATLARST